MTRRITIGAVVLIAGFMILATVSMLLTGHELIMPAPARFFTSAISAILWFCIGWLCGSKDRERAP